MDSSYHLIWKYVSLNYYLLRMSLYIKSKNRGLLLYGSSVALNFHLLRMTSYIVCNAKIFHLYWSSSVPSNFHLMRMTLYIECKAKVFLLYGSSFVALKLHLILIKISLLLLSSGDHMACLQAWYRSSRFSEHSPFLSRLGQILRGCHLAKE